MADIIDLASRRAEREKKGSQDLTVQSQRLPKGRKVAWQDTAFFIGMLGFILSLWAFVPAGFGRPAILAWISLEAACLSTAIFFFVAAIACIFDRRLPHEYTAPAHRTPNKARSS